MTGGPRGDKCGHRRYGLGNGLRAKHDHHENGTHIHANLAGDRSVDGAGSRDAAWNFPASRACRLGRLASRDDLGPAARHAFDTFAPSRGTRAGGLARLTAHAAANFLYLRVRRNARLARIPHQRLLPRPPRPVRVYRPIAGTGAVAAATVSAHPKDEDRLVICGGARHATTPRENRRQIAASCRTALAARADRVF